MTNDEDKWQQWENWKRQLHQVPTSTLGSAYRSVNEGDAARRLDEIPYEWCSLLHRAAVYLSSHVHAFYVCFYQPGTVKDKPLHFAYNYDDGRYDDPCWEALGTGPTSLVVRTGQPFVMTPQTRQQQHAGINFGKPNKISLSAVHLPLRCWESGEEAPIVCGVFSAQSYTPGLWTRQNDPFMLQLQARADEAFSFWKQQEAEAARRAFQVALQTRQETEARAMVRILLDVNKKLEATRASLPSGAASARRALDEASQFIHQQQTQISARQTVPDAVLVAAPLSNASTLSPPPAVLTKREAEVWSLLRQNWSNAQIANALFVSERTVKFHCANIREKTGQGRARVFAQTEKPTP